MAAQQGKTLGKQIILLDKGRTVGGRLATRAIGPGLADSGAQFFTVREPAFQRLVDEWQAAGLVYTWSTGWSDGSLIAAPANDGYPRYAVRGGMNALAQHLAAHLTAQGITLQTDQQVTAVTQIDDGWQVTTASGERHQAQTLILTPPAPQSLASARCRRRIPGRGRPQCAGAHHLRSPVSVASSGSKATLPCPTPAPFNVPALIWPGWPTTSAGHFPAATLITVHAGPAYSAIHDDTPDEELLATFQASLQPFLRGRVKCHAAQLKRWRYALPTVTHPARYLQAQGLPPLYFGGDAFGGPRVEGAALSGLAMGAAIGKTLPIG
ncbi:MAG: FAD-dependent oxidoreductase [Caldilineaceae bacterium]